MRVHPPELITATVYGEFAAPIMTAEYTELDGAEKFDNKHGVEVKQRNYTLYLYNGGNFKAEDISGPEYLYRLQYDMEDMADGFDTELRKIHPLEGTFSGRLTDLPAMNVETFIDKIRNIDGVTNVKNNEASIIPAEITFETTLNGENVTVLLFLSQRHYSITDVPLETFENIENIPQNLYNDLSTLLDNVE